MKKLGNLLKWLLAGIVFLGLGAAAYVFESDGGYGFSLIIKEPFVPGYLFVEDIFRMKPEGCVVVGYVKGRLRVNEPVTIRNRYGTVIRTTIDGIEVFKKKKPAAVDTPAALYFRTVEPEMIYIDDIIQNIKRAEEEG